MGTSPAIQDLMNKSVVEILEMKDTVEEYYGPKVFENVVGEEIATIATMIETQKRAANEGNANQMKERAHNEEPLEFQKDKRTFKDVLANGRRGVEQADTIMTAKAKEEEQSGISLKPTSFA